MADTSDRGLGSPNMSEEEKHKIQSMGGQAQPKQVKREAGKKGGSRSRRS
jgi:hypothetical protein